MRSSIPRPMKCVCTPRLQAARLKLRLKTVGRASQLQRNLRETNAMASSTCLSARIALAEDWRCPALPGRGTTIRFTLSLRNGEAFKGQT